MPPARAGARSKRSPGRGELAGIIDLTTSELTDFLTGGVYSAGDARLTAAGAAGVPQVVVPGCLDFTNWWVGEVPERYRQREFFQYNVEILLMRTNAEEFAALGQLIGERLSAAKGPVRVLIPRGGWSALTSRKAHDLAGRETGPWARPDTDRRVRRDARASFAGRGDQGARPSHQRRGVRGRLRRGADRAFLSPASGGGSAPDARHLGTSITLLSGFRHRSGQHNIRAA